jgi:hypothetical protein
MTGHSRAHHPLVLGVHPTARGFRWVLFESPLSPVDWGAASAKIGRNSRLLARFGRILARYQPDTVILEQFEDRGSRRPERVRLLCRAFTHLASTKGMETVVYSRFAINACFASVGATTRHEIAQAISSHIDVFNHLLPRKRSPGASADSRQAHFDAAALAITYFAIGEHAPPWA